MLWSKKMRYTPQINPTFVKVYEKFSIALSESGNLYY